MSRTLRIRLDLLPQLPYIHPQILGVGVGGPQLLEQESVGQNFSGMLDEDTQQFVFLGRELDVVAAELDDPPHQVDGEVPDAKDRPFTLDLELMADRGSDPREKLLHAKRLGDIVVGTEV